MNHAPSTSRSPAPNGRPRHGHRSLLLRGLAPLSLLLLLSLGTPVTQADDFPTVLWSLHDTGKAAWVTPDRATFDHGQIDWTLFGDLQSAVLRRAIERHTGPGCISIGSLRKQRIGSGVAHNLDELARNSFGVFAGTIVNRGAGFADGDPATLLQVRVDKVIKKSSEFSIRKTGDVLYVAYPVAEVQVKDQKICKSDDTLLAETPRIGDKVIVFPMTGPLNEDRNMMYLYDQELLVEKPGDGLGVPKRWRSDAAMPFLTKDESLPAGGD
ncbi:MAG TPA: hypothetical protein VF173_29290 [Thermoanaerobaculia bacterium]|nr:hypothetical protein [Thermoanaerobaculia bacterium]